jgi:hypothetical protein
LNQALSIIRTDFQETTWKAFWMTVVAEDERSEPPEVKMINSCVPLVLPVRKEAHASAQRRGEINRTPTIIGNKIEEKRTLIFANTR